VSFGKGVPRTTPKIQLKPMCQFEPAETPSWTTPLRLVGRKIDKQTGEIEFENLGGREARLQEPFWAGRIDEIRKSFRRSISETNMPVIGTLRNERTS
jgi:hypothetical protein